MGHSPQPDPPNTGHPKVRLALQIVGVILSGIALTYVVLLVANLVLGSMGL